MRYLFEKFMSLGFFFSSKKPWHLQLSDHKACNTFIYCYDSNLGNKIIYMYI